jgi:hypothetical protein
MAISPVSHPSMSELIDQIASDATLEQAYHWLCKRREKLSHNNDVWNLRRHWRQKKQELQQTSLRGEFRFSPQVEVRLPDGKLECWCALDSLVLKAMTIVHMLLFDMLSEFITNRYLSTHLS